MKKKIDFLKNRLLLSETINVEVSISDLDELLRIFPNVKHKILYCRLFEGYIDFSLSDLCKIENMPITDIVPFANRITSGNIIQISDNGIFVFGSNEAGKHGAGAAKYALNFGAKMGIGVGLQGNTYAIPTKDKDIRTLPTNAIYKYIDDFITFAVNKPDLTFFVTEIGCGLAGYKPEQIAPLFVDAINVTNIHLPISFWAVLENMGLIESET